MHAITPDHKTVNGKKNDETIDLKTSSVGMMQGDGMKG